MDKDFRVRAYLFIKSGGIALGLYDHVLDVKGEAVDINSGKPNAEMRLVEIGDGRIVTYDLAFPPNKQGIAMGLFNHTKNIKATKLPDTSEDETGYVSIERCGHRVGQSCKLIERYDVA